MLAPLKLPLTSVELRFYPWCFVGQKSLLFAGLHWIVSSFVKPLCKESGMLEDPWLAPLIGPHVSLSTVSYTLIMFATSLYHLY